MYDIGIALYAGGLDKDLESPGLLKGAVARGIGWFLQGHPLVSDIVVERALLEAAQESGFKNALHILETKGISYLVDMSKKSFVKNIAQYAHVEPGSGTLECLTSEALEQWEMPPGPLFLEKEGVVRPVSEFGSRTIIFRSRNGAMEYFADALKKHKDNGGYVLRDAPELF